MGAVMVVVAVLVAVIVLLGAGGLALWVRRVRGCGRTIGAPAGEHDQIYPGDVMCRHAMMSGSLARLQFFDWGIRLRGIAMSRWVVPTWEARYDELAVVDLVGLHWSRKAVWFRLRGEAGGIGLLTNWSKEILRELERRDVPVNRSLTKIRRTADLYPAP
jgi:hypothetical protein